MLLLASDQPRPRFRPPKFGTSPVSALDPFARCVLGLLVAAKAKGKGRAWQTVGGAEGGSAGKWMQFHRAQDARDRADSVQAGQKLSSKHGVCAKGKGRAVWEGAGVFFLSVRRGGVLSLLLRGLLRPVLSSVAVLSCVSSLLSVCLGLVLVLVSASRVFVLWFVSCFSRPFVLGRGREKCVDRTSVGS